MEAGESVDVAAGDVVADDIHSEFACEIETAGCLPLLINPTKAGLMMSHVNKTRKLDANRLATLLRIGSLPTVWLPPAAMRDQRGQLRTRMSLCTMRTSLTHRTHSLLAMSTLPSETGRCLSQHLKLLDSLLLQITAREDRIRGQIASFPYAPIFSSYDAIIAASSISPADVQHVPRRRPALPGFRSRQSYIACERQARHTPCAAPPLVESSFSLITAEAATRGSA